jgi:hypothetical protein
MQGFFFTSNNPIKQFTNPLALKWYFFILNLVQDSELNFKIKEKRIAEITKACKTT